MMIFKFERQWSTLKANMAKSSHILMQTAVPAYNEICILPISLFINKEQPYTLRASY